MERDNRIELLTKPWQGFVLPLNQSRIKHIETHYLVLTYGVGLSPAIVVMRFNMV